MLEVVREREPDKDIPDKDIKDKDIKDKELKDKRVKARSTMVTKEGPQMPEVVQEVLKYQIWPQFNQDPL